MRVKFRGIPATNPASACALLEEAGVCIIIGECHQVSFTMGQRRGSTCRVTITEATVLINDNLRRVWGGSRTVGDKYIICEESLAAEEEEEQTESTATLSPTSPYSSDILQQWLQVWHILGVEEVDILEIILLAVNCHLPDWQGETVHNWSPSTPRPLKGVWEGTGAGQGQLRLRGHRFLHQTVTHISYERRMPSAIDRVLTSGSRGLDIICRKGFNAASGERGSRLGFHVRRAYEGGMASLWTQHPPW